MLQDPTYHQQTLDACPGFIWRTASDGQIRYCNRSWLAFAGLSSPSLFGSRWFDRVHPDDADAFRRQFAHAHETAVPLRISCRFRRHDGEYRLLVGQMVPLLLEDGTYDGHVADLVDATGLLPASSLHAGATDALTGLPDLSGWMDRLATELDRANRYNTPLSILVLDIAGMSAINDIYSNEAGDGVLRRIGVELPLHVRSHDFCGRWRDDLFLVMLPETKIRDADTVMGHLCDVVSETEIPWDNLILKVSAVCASARRIAGDTPETMMHRLTEEHRRVKAELEAELREELAELGDEGACETDAAETAEDSEPSSASYGGLPAD